jgi:anti-sigma factor (TIGR02949 family)
MSDCEKATTYMMLYMDGEINKHQAAELARHTAVCAECREAFEVYDHMNELLSQGTQEEAPPGDFTAAVMSKIVALPEEERPKKFVPDNAAYAFFGTLSVLFGTGFLAFLSRDQIFAAMSESALAPFAAAIAPLYEHVQNFITSVQNLASEITTAVSTAMPWLSYAFLAIFAGLVSVIYFLKYRGGAEELDTEK